MFIHDCLMKGLEISHIPEVVRSGPQNQGPDACTILIVDDENLVRMVAKQRLKVLNHRLLEAANGREALDILRHESVDLVLSDWIMPELDGLGLCEAIKHDDRLKSIHFILMTSLDEPGQIAEGLSRGADDFLVKSASPQEILARVGAGLRSRRLYLDLEKSHRLLHEKQTQLDNELSSASEFVRSLLPKVGEVAPGIRLAWEFLPSSHLGGDLFQVTRWGEEHLGIMILDMSGHGTAPALRAVSLAMWFKGDHIVRSFSDFDPGQIVTQLNKENPMTEQGDYFTIWVGVLQLSSRVLRFASAGHPGAILVRNQAPLVVLGEKSWPVGFSFEQTYSTQSITMEDHDRLYVFSDGVYEVVNQENEIWGKLQLQEALESVHTLPMKLGLTKVIRMSRAWQANGIFGDDVALVGIELGEKNKAGHR